MSAPLRQASFASGELSPEIGSNSPHYARGLRTCLNAFATKGGRIHNRPGTTYIGLTRDAGASTPHLVPFIFSDSQSFVLEFGEEYVRFFTGGEAVIAATTVVAWDILVSYSKGNFVSYLGAKYRSKVNANLGNVPNISPTQWAADSTYEIVSPYALLDVPRLRFSQTGDVVLITHPSYAPRELRRLANDSWTLTAASFTLDAPWIGGTPPAFESVIWDTAPAAYSALVDYAVGNHVTSGGFTYIALQVNGPATTVKSPSANADYWAYDGWVATTTYGESDYVYVAGVLYVSLLPRNINHAPGAGAPWWAVAADTSHPQREWEWVFTFLWKDSTGALRETKAYTTVLRSPSGKWPLASDRPAKLSSINAALGLFSLAYTITAVRWYRGRNGVRGWVGDVDSDGTVAGTPMFKDDGQAPDFSVQPPKGTNPFDAASGAGTTTQSYPAVATHHDQRRIYGRSTQKPSTIFGSALGNFDDFDHPFPVQEDDAFEFKLAAARLEDIRAMVTLERLILFTGAGEWSADGTQGEAISAVNVNVRRHTEHGSAWLAPLVVGSRVLFNSTRGNEVRDFAYDWGLQTYVSDDVSVHGRHLLDGYSIVDWAYQRHPHSIVWAIRDDGVLLSLTFDAKAGVLAWARHTTADDDEFERVCCVPENVTEDQEAIADAVYFVVKRGTNVRCIERMAERRVAADTDIRQRVFLDSAIIGADINLDGARTMRASGASYAAEAEVTITAAGHTPFSVLSIGSDVVLDPDGDTETRVRITGYTSTTVVTGILQTACPAAFQNIATTDWGFAYGYFPTTLNPNLNGRTVYALCDGEVQGPLAVATNAVTFDPPALYIVIGLPYVTDIEPLDLVTDKVVSIDSVAVEVVNSRGFKVGSTLANVRPAKVRAVTESYAHPELQTGKVDVRVDSKWSREGRCAIRQDQPLPLTILSITREVTAGGKP